LLQLAVLSPDKEPEEFEKGLNDQSAAVRYYANLRLTPSRRTPEMRQRIFDKFSPIARDPHDPRRQQAIELIESDYDPKSPDGALSSEVLSFMADLAADPDAQIRSAAVQYLFSKYFSDLKIKPDSSHLQLKDREKVTKQLQWDIDDHQPYSEQAQKLLAVIGGSR
jgi:hypothetical protein